MISFTISGANLKGFFVIFTRYEFIKKFIFSWLFVFVEITKHFHQSHFLFLTSTAVYSFLLIFELVLIVSWENDSEIRGWFNELATEEAELDDKAINWTSIEFSEESRSIRSYVVNGARLSIISWIDLVDYNYDSKHENSFSTFSIWLCLS